MYKPVTPTTQQARVIARTRELLADPKAVIPADLAGDLHGSTAFLNGYLTGQLESLLDVAEDLAGITGDEA